MVGLTEGLLDVGVGLLLAGFAYAAVADWRDREVTDRLWQLLGVAGFAVGGVAVAPGGALPIALWVAVAALTIEHMFPWDEHLGDRFERFANAIELAAYAGVIAIVVLAAARVGIGPTGVPAAVVAVLATVVFARVLFEAGVLYGGADAKAMMTAGLLVPLFPTPWLWPQPGPLPVTSFLPFSVDLLMNAALFSVAIPLGLAVRNVTRKEFHGLRGFTGYSLPVSELPQRFVWVRDPAVDPTRPEEESAETSEDDRRVRTALAGELTARGIARVWVTPQVPFLVLMAAGALAAVLAGNLVVDLIRIL